MSEGELTGLDWLNTVTLSLAALEVDPAKGGTGTRARSASLCSAESGYNSSSSESADDVAEVLRSDSASKEAWERAKTGATQASLPSIESVTAVAITLLKGSGATADKIVDYIRKSIPYYSKINRSSLLSSVVASLESNRHFQPTDKGGKTLWSCTRGASKGRKERRRRASPGVGKRKRGSAKLKARTATQKPVPPITVACEPSSIVCGAVDAMLSDPVAMIPDESADALLLALSGDDSGEDMDIPSDMFTTFDVSGVSALDTLPSPYDLGIDGLGDLSCLLDTPSQAWLPTSYIPPLVGDDGLGIC